MKKFLFIICLILLNPLSTQATEEICLEFDNEFQPLTINDDSRSTLQSSNEDSISDRDIDETDSASPIEDENLLEETPAFSKCPFSAFVVPFLWITSFFPALSLLTILSFLSTKPT